MCIFLVQSTNMRKCTWLFVKSSQYKTPTSTSTESSKPCRDGTHALKCAGTSLTYDCTAVQQMGCIQCRTDWSFNCDHLNNSTCSRRFGSRAYRNSETQNCTVVSLVFASSDRYLQPAKLVEMLFTVPRASWHCAFMVHTQTAACHWSLYLFNLPGEFN